MCVRALSSEKNVTTGPPVCLQFINEFKSQEEKVQNNTVKTSSYTSETFFEHFWFIVLRTGAIRFRLSISLRGMNHPVSTGTSDDQRVSLSSL